MSQSTGFFEDFNRLNVLIAGDVMIDRYISGKVNRISPEAPVPVVQMEEAEDRLGGAANVALNIKAMGATPFLCSVTGDDENGNTLQQLLPQNGISPDFILRSPERVTTTKTRIIAQNQHLLRVDKEDKHDLTEQEADTFLAKVRGVLDANQIHVILFQDYNKGVLSATVIDAVIREALGRGIPTAVDPKFHNFWAYRQVSLFKPNLREIQNQLQDPVRPTLASLNAAAAQIRMKLGNRASMITLSEKGIFVDEDGKSEVFGARPRQIADVCGAGDTVISVAALGLGLGMRMSEIAVLANMAGGQVCEKVGVVPVDKAALEQEYMGLLDPE